ncbi:MAG: YlbF family regulator [Planctomycetes bacterium]|nr:YlbF family regulator [Planctomycetota bacterium]
MNNIIHLADQLGKAIRESSQAKALQEAQKAITDKPELSQLIQDYEAQVNRIASLERDNKPIEVADKHKLADIQNKLVVSPTFKKLSEAQMEYVDLMRKVNETLRAQL